MEKHLTFHSRTANGVFAYAIDTEHRHLTKTAAEYHPTISAYINNAKKIPGKTQVLITALGAGEYWGANANGDWFPETALANEGDTHGYKTFERYAKLFKHHVNKPDSPSYGEVLLSVYNPTFHRVELIITFDHERAPDLVEKVDRGDTVEFSMGCKVPYDICSICGNKAATRAQYCEHLRYYLNKIHPETGRQVYAINTLPRFFDISYVLIGADKTAKSHLKVASLGGMTVGSAEMAEKQAAKKVAAKKLAVHRKEADIEKEVPAGTPPGSFQTVTEEQEQSIRQLSDAMMELRSRERSLPRSILNMLGRAPLRQSMSTMAMMGIMPKPEEFQRIVCIKLNRPDVADYLDERRQCFDPFEVSSCPSSVADLMPISASHYSDGIMQALRPFVADRSAYEPHIGTRMAVLIKSASKDTPYSYIKMAASNDDRKPVSMGVVLALAAGLYASFAKKAPVETTKGLGGLIEKHPALAAAIGYGLYRTFNPLIAPSSAGQMVGPKVNPDSNKFGDYSRGLSKRALSKEAGLGLKHIVVGIPAAYMASGVLQAHKDTHPHHREGRLSSFMRQYPDLVSAGLTGLVLYPKLKKTAQDVPPLGKVAAVENFLMNAIVPAIAMGGGASLPGRIVGGVFDHGVITLANKWQNRRKQGDGINKVLTRGG